MHHGVLVAVAVCLCAWCSWISGFHTDTAAAVATWCISVVIVAGVNLTLWSWRRSHGPGAGLVTVAEPWPRTARGGAPRSMIGLSPWVVLIGVALTWDVLGIDTGPHEAHLTLSALAQAFRPVNALLLLFWMLTGMAYGLARARVRPPGSASEPGSPQTLVALVVPAGVLPGAGAALRLPSLLLPSNRPTGLAFWALAIVAGVVIDQVSRKSDGTFATAGEAVRFASSTVTARVLLATAWLFAGYHLFAR